MNEILAIIPARGGSKGVPKKNIKPLNGVPLIGYTLQEAKKSKYINRVVVSTDDEEIAETSRIYGGEVPFLRPKELAADHTPGMDPIIHCINWFKNHENYIPDYVCLLQCTSPFRRVEHMDEALEKLINSNSNSLVSLCESEVTPYWMKKIEDGLIKDFLDNGETYPRRQDAPKVYTLNGAIYICKTEELIKNRTWYSETTLPYIMDRMNSIDIDDIIDFKFAELLMKEGY